MTGWSHQGQQDGKEEETVEQAEPNHEEEDLEEGPKQGRTAFSRVTDPVLCFPDGGVLF